MQIDRLNYFGFVLAALLLGIAIGGFFAEAGPRMINGSPQFAIWAIMGSSIITIVVQLRNMRERTRMQIKDGHDPR